VGFTDTFTDIHDVIDIDGSREVRRAESYLNGYYDNRMFPAVSEGHPGIDSDIWADLQRYRQ
jgi:hypothetical protein